MDRDVAAVLEEFARNGDVARDAVGAVVLYAKAGGPGPRDVAHFAREVASALVVLAAKLDAAQARGGRAHG